MFAASEHGTHRQLTNSTCYSFFVKRKQCNVCGRRFRTPAVMHMHKRLCHETEKDSSHETVASAGSTSADTSLEAFQNGQCLLSVWSSFPLSPVSGYLHGTHKVNAQNKMPNVSHGSIIAFCVRCTKQVEIARPSVFLMHY